MHQLWVSRNDGKYFKLCKISREFLDKFREYYRMNTTNSKYINNQQMHFKIYDVLYPQRSHHTVSTGIPAIYKVIL
jgi:hypothetical protein